MHRSLMFSLCLALSAASAEARAIRFQFEPIVPTVPGIERDAAPSYDPLTRGPLVHYDELPAADVQGLGRPAPPNGCEDRGGGFAVVSGPRAQRGCYGGD